MLRKISLFVLISASFAFASETREAVLESRDSETYQKLVSKAKIANAKLDDFVNRKSKQCEELSKLFGKQKNLQLTPQGRLVCIDTPTPPPAAPKPEDKK